MPASLPARWMFAGCVSLSSHLQPGSDLGETFFFLPSFSQQQDRWLYLPPLNLRCAQVDAPHHHHPGRFWTCGTERSGHFEEEEKNTHTFNSSEHTLQQAIWRGYMIGHAVCMLKMANFFSGCDVLLIAAYCDITDPFKTIIHSYSYSYYPRVGEATVKWIVCFICPNCCLLVNVLKFIFMLVCRSWSLWLAQSVFAVTR